MENVALIGGFWQVAVQGLQTSESASYLYNRAHLYLPVIWLRSGLRSPFSYVRANLRRVVYSHSQRCNLHSALGPLELRRRQTSLRVEGLQGKGPLIVI